MMLAIDLIGLNERMEASTPPEILNWAWDRFGPAVVATSSFQTQSLPLLHMISVLTPEMPVLFVDTGYHFPETAEFRRRLADELGLNVIDVKPPLPTELFERRYGTLHQTDSDRCCHLNKVRPLQQALERWGAWVSGIRRDQTRGRRHIPILAHHPLLSLLKINPMAAWTREDIEGYIEENNLPRHPLWEQGYRSIGCAPCTAPVSNGQHEREGRWPGDPKTECGLHFELG